MILQHFQILGGIENICKPSWQKTHPLIWTDVKTDVFVWIVLMAVCLLKSKKKIQQKRTVVIIFIPILVPQTTK